jgi:sulfide:quinone oxidoreductase
MAKKVVIVGGGVGGVASAKNLAVEAGRNGVDVEITLITKEPRHYMPPLFFDVAMGEASPEETYAPIENLERYFGVKVVVDPVARIDAENHRVITETGISYEYDYLVVALGSTQEWGKYPGLDRAGYHNYTLEGAVQLREALRRFRGGEVVVLIPETPYRCGIYPYEVATVLGVSFRNAGIKAHITILTPDPKPVTPLGKDIHSMWFEAFEELGIDYVVHKGLQEVDPERRVVRTANAEARFDLLIKVPPPGLPEPLARSEGFTWKQDPRFAPAVAPTFRHPDYDNVYMVGEHSMVPAGISMAGVFVHNASLVATNNILAELIGFFPRYTIPTATCAGYVKDKGFMGHCEIRYNPETGKYEWANRCYLGPISSLARLFKVGFYKSWLDALR